MEKLKSCFRCHSKNTIIDNYGSDGKIGVCKDCGLMSPWFEIEEEAIDWWNNRPFSLISVKERLPANENQNYLVLTKKGSNQQRIYTAYYYYDVRTGKHKWLNTVNRYEIWDVIAWQPLSEISEDE